MGGIIRVHLKIAALFGFMLKIFEKTQIFILAAERASTTFLIFADASFSNVPSRARRLQNAPYSPAAISRLSRILLNSFADYWRLCPFARRIAPLFAASPISSAFVPKASWGLDNPSTPALKRPNITQFVGILSKLDLGVR